MGKERVAKLRRPNGMEKEWLVRPKRMAKAKMAKVGTKQPPNMGSKRLAMEE